MKKIIYTIFFVIIVFIVVTLFFSYLILNSGNILHNFDFIKVDNVGATYYLYFEDVPSINQDAAAIFVARKNYIDWVMQTKEFEQLKVKTLNKKDKSLIVAVQIVNAIVDAYLTVIKQYSDEEIQLVNRFTGYKATIFTAPFLQDTDYPHKFLTLELSICKKVIQALEENRTTIIKEIQCFLDELLNVENKLFDNMVVPFSIKS